MASSSVIGALRVVLGLDTASYESGLSKAEKQAQASTEKIAGVFTALTIAAGAAVVGFGAAILSSIENIDKLGKSAEKAGIPIAEFSVIASTASKAGIDLDTFTASMVKLTKALSEAGSGKLTGPASNAFEALGISARDSTGNLRASADVIELLADKFAKFRDSPEKTALALALFGRAGAEMIPFLNKGGEAIRKQREEMESLGLVLDENTKNKAREFTEAWKKLTNVIDSILTRIAIGLLPTLTDITTTLAQLAKDAKNTTTISETLASAFKSAAIEGSTFALEARQIAKDIVGIGDAIGLTVPFFSALARLSFAAATADFKGMKDAVTDLWKSTGSLSAAWEKFQQVTEESNAAQAKLMAGYKNATQGANEVKAAVDVLNIGLTNEIELARQVSDSLKITAPKLPTESITKAIQDITLKTKVMNQEFAAFPSGFAELAHGLDPLFKLPATMDQLTGQMKLLAQAQLNLKGAQITQENLTPWDALAQKMTELELLVNRGAISFETYERAAKKAADNAGLSFVSASKSISDSFTEAASAFGDSQSQIVKQAKVLHAAQALIATYAGAAEALAGPFPANLVAAAAVLAKGLVLVAAIKGVGFKEGGSFKVGGSGGPDSKLIQFMATPGEMVDVKTPAQQAAAASANTGSGGVQTITLQARRMTDLMTLDDLRILTEKLNSANRDGYKLKFAS